MAIKRDNGKGDLQRPLGVSMEEFDNQWDAIFKSADKKKKTEVEVHAENGEASINVTKTWDI
jgi:hypothetical protein